ncbi:hypothetical protein MRS76_12135 [Rhizobiaceae bacterium n13]|uniref:Type I secretion protein n=1 Tax=Ferirhizobium litorale TaxID=2927786 RepID=A0AAE3QID2_9HYPH|nr:hypothetical protein [Fererhizobium litorale]MDI7862708.1 hypothetical protein [Fererhizobium litorale]MDI7924428.1 hypothetical protein [Fererhizobium litorale]
MTTMDRITEEIAHFIGLFQINAENAIVREKYDEGEAYRPLKPDIDPDIVAKPPFSAPYEFVGFDPGVNYRPPGPDPMFGDAFLVPHGYVFYRPLDLHPFSYHPAWPDTVIPNSFSTKLTIETEVDLEPPGSVATLGNQVIFLSDNDYFSVGGHGLKFSPEAIHNGALLDIAEAADSLSPIGNLQQPGSTAEMIETIKDAAAQLDAFVADPDSPWEVFIHRSEAIEGTYVNGKLVDEAPKLETYHAFDDDEDEEGDDEDHHGNAWVGEDGSIVVEASVKLTAGENTLVNEAIVKSFWTAAKVTAVVGDYCEVNAIVQTNVLCDEDALTESIGSWMDESPVNDIFNIATFERLDLSADDDPVDAALAGFPKHWAITELEGDLVMTNWLQQFCFQSDNDVGILSSSGVTTNVVSGDNTGVNQTSIFELGFSYDLMIIGGCVYDANLIQQINVLFDNDVVGAMPDFSTNGTGSVSSSGNLLWNQAHINNIGGADRFGALPEYYLETAKKLGAGGDDLSKGVLNDSAFAGLDGLRVLYIKGDLINLNYVKQTNILGDSDQIALAMNAIKPYYGSDWSLVTGDNSLINNAAIYNLDSFGKTYVGGEKYSQETLIQAELISSKPDFGGQYSDALVSEAVLFLDNSMLEPASQEAEPGVYIPSAHDGPQDDGLQHMLGH